jgi:Zn-dependent peptidase ImmA (M78 family)
MHGDEQYNKAELCEMMSLDEWAADRGAAALLMPRQLVCATSKLMFGSKEIPIFGNNILMNDDKQRIIEMADYLGVSFTSLLIRMKELKLFKYHSMDQYISLTMGDMEQAVNV